MSQSKEQKAKAFEAALNRHGFALQYAVARSAKDLAAIESSNWFSFVPEFPARVQGTDTRIDLILQHRRRKRSYLVVETKRANPALAYWCFAKSGLRADWADDALYSEILCKVGGQFFTKVRHIRKVDAVYDVAVEASTGEKGDDRGSRSGAIEDAVGQVCRGLNGLIEYFRLYGNGDEEPFEFIPVVVTTAELLTTTKPLTESDLSTGKVALGGEVQSRPWVFFRYPQSPGLKHSVPVSEAHTSHLGEALEVIFSRIIAIVHADTVEQFLSSGYLEKEVL
jgi:hypothetical protein